MGGAPAPGPMDGASDVPPADPSMGGGDPNAMGGGMDPMGGPDPSMGGEDPMGGQDPMMGPPPADGDGQLNPDMGGMDDPGMGGEGEGTDDSTMSIINQLSPEDLDAVRAYAESMLSRDETKNGGEDDMGGDDPGMGGEDPMGPPPADGGQQPPMMESFTFKKKDLKKINEALNIMEPDDEEKRNKRFEKKRGKSVNKKSPFNSPKFK